MNKLAPNLSQYESRFKSDLASKLGLLKFEFRVGPPQQKLAHACFTATTRFRDEGSDGRFEEVHHKVLSPPAVVKKR